MPADSVLVIDAGTSSLRAVAVGADGSVERVAREPYNAFPPADGSPFARELDAEGVAASLARLLEAAAPLRPRIAGLAVTGQREGLVLCGGDGAPLVISPNIDARASAEGMAIDALQAQRVYAVTGHLPSLMQAPAKLAWLRAHRPDVAQRVARVVPLGDWLGTVLAGEAACSRTLAAENGLLEVATGTLAASLLADLGMPPTLVPRIVPEGSIIGRVRGGAFEGLSVVLAGADTQCALVGIGVLVPRDAGVVAGWSAPVQLVVEAPVMDAASRTWTGLHVAPGCWVLESNAGETGRAWEWACHLLAVAPDEAAELAATSPAGARDALAVLGPRSMRASQMNAGVGALTVPLPLVMTSPERADVLRSVLEGLAFSLRANVEQIERVSGVRIDRLALGGGMARAALLGRIVADVLGRTIEIASSGETSALGAAAVASPVLGLHATLERAVEAMTGGRGIVEPHVRTSAQYDDVYERWCALARHLEGGGE